MGIGVSIVLIAFGAILTWAVTAHVNGINVHSVGVILLILGLVSLGLSLAFWQSWFGPGYWGRQRAIPTGGAVPRRRFSYGAGQQRVVQDDVVEVQPVATAAPVVTAAPAAPVAPPPGEPLP